ncbi:MAG: hypothetical protein VB948_16270 [Pseudomonadales bacterium]
MPRCEGRIACHLGVLREIRDEPRRIVSLMGDGLFSTWRARGGGFFGLGYLIAFVVLELQMISTEVRGSDGVVEFFTSQIVEYIFRFAVQSLVNVILALIWPVYVLQWLGGWGLVALGGGYLLFEKVLRPYVEGWFPQLQTKESKSAVEKSL